MNTKNAVTSFVVATALAVSSASAAVSFSDSFETNTLGNYNISAAPGDFSHSSTAGTAGAGGVAIAATGAALPSLVHQTGFTLAAGESLDMSVLVQKSTQGYNGSSQLFLGITSQSNDSFGGSTSPGNSAIGVIVNSFAQIGTRSSTGSGNNIGNFTPSGPFNLVNGNWYKITTTLTKPTTGSDWTVSGQFQDWGSSGTSLVSTILTLPSTTVPMASAAFNEATVTNYGEFGIRQPAWSGADNFTFTSVPEPSAMALFGAGALALGSRRRR